MSIDVQISGDREFRLQSGISLAQAGKLEEAAVEFNALLAGNSQDTDALNNLAIVYRRQGKSQDALGALLEAIDIDPTKAEFQYNLGKVYKQLGNFKSAAMAYAKAVENEPSLVPAYINLGAVYYLLREFGKAANFLKKGLDIAANELLRVNYEAALRAKQTAESSGRLPEDGSSGDGSPETEISEAGDIFIGIPVPAGAESAVAAAGEANGISIESAAFPAETTAPGAPPETVFSCTLTGILGLLRYLLELAAFFPASARQFFNERGIEQSIRDISDALSSLEKDTPQAIPETESADVFVPAGDQISIASLTNMLNHLGKLTQDLPQTEQRDILKRKVENLIEGLNATALE
ncbi:MAG: tetratricopeptide repeat protein [Treponema sp.]|jgi:tetratricopeptide (TPR) repeat protein|nr:tetratricopeptide repeat protein [Treponema sp.]